MKGALHVHSTYSDGEFTLAELRQVYLAQGCSFVCMTDHAEYFDVESIHRYRQDLQLNSDREFCFVPGLEYRCEREMHILGYGATELAVSTDPEVIIRHIAAQRATSVIAHPKDEFFSWIESFATLPAGIETWNSKYDGRYGPRPCTFALLRRLRQRAPETRAFYGQDLHWRKQYRGLCVVIDGDVPEPAAILAALATGNYHGQKDELQLPSSGDLPDALLVKFGEAHARSRRVWRAFRNGKRTLERLGIRVPESLKSQLRRIF